jgi:hypothetical protein
MASAESQNPELSAESDNFPAVGAWAADFLVHKMTPTQVASA